MGEFNQHNIKRPTYIKTNKITDIYQEIIDTYGIPSYLEANPAVLTIVTFPFFFGMMFGDLGHGSLILIFGILLVFFPDMFKGTDFAGFKRARYILFLMGVFATYAGLIYNEWFAIPTNMFGSCYDINEIGCSAPLKQEVKPPNGEVGLAKCEGARIYRRPDSMCVYPIGQDPAWSISNNKLSATNSIKMKMSVIFGVIHMTMGIIIKGMNATYFKKYVILITEVIAGLIILWGLFGWMDILIILKFFKQVDIDSHDLAPLSDYDKYRLEKLEDPSVKS